MKFSLTSRLYAFAFFSDFILIYPLYSLLFDDSQISISQIASLLIAWSFTGFLLEVPSGSIADKYPRKNVLVAATIVQAMGFGCWLVFQNYYGFLAGFILWGVNSALTSGTTEALVYDELSDKKALPTYTKVMGRLQAFGLTGEILAGAGAAVLASSGYTVILLFSVAAALIAGAVVYSLPKAKAMESTEEVKLLSYLRRGFALAFSKSRVLYIILFISILGGLSSVDEYYSLFLREKHFSNTDIALWSAVLGIFGVVGSLLAHRIEKKKLPLEFLVLLWGGLLFGASLAPAIFAPLLLGVFVLFFSLITVLFNTYLQHAINSETRATTTSVGAFFSELFALLTYVIVGLTAQRGYAWSLKIVAVIIVGFAGLLIIYSRYLKNRAGHSIVQP